MMRENAEAVGVILPRPDLKIDFKLQHRPTLLTAILV
jgi:hypothetical protein